VRRSASVPHCGAPALANSSDSVLDRIRDQESPSARRFPMKNEEKNSNLFYLIIALIILGFIASLAFPLSAKDHNRSSSSFLSAGNSSRN
jgi:hypothetical protein